ncbi:hypothetical protein [Mangrovimonas spongiae]|uniref:DUF4292 domain-containing protein n=1 Tax=Mangrovimonas spongiae TaxID=2494697 RepID=A0A428K4Q6_9FLAO|nr:hypothetical protein [Mangrovimonas spongiae]RSK41387.1 hypothetical protein EJA19_00500 [Mangrovimonas spongiae]
MRYLTLSFLAVFLFSCGSYPKKQQLKPIESALNVFSNPYFSNTSKDYIYKANISAYGKSFSGLFIVKKIEKNQHRVAFTTEMGNKIFDFTITDNAFSVNYILDDLNRKLLLNVLKQDFTTLVKENVDISGVFVKDNASFFETQILDKPHYYVTKNNSLSQIVSVKNGKAKTVFSFSKINDNIANKITITHHNITLKINLKSIN